MTLPFFVHLICFIHTSYLHICLLPFVFCFFLHCWEQNKSTPILRCKSLPSFESRGINDLSLSPEDAQLYFSAFIVQDLRLRRVDLIHTRLMDSPIIIIIIILLTMIVFHTEVCGSARPLPPTATSSRPPHTLKLLLTALSAIPITISDNLFVSALNYKCGWENVTARESPLSSHYLCTPTTR